VRRGTVLETLWWNFCWVALSFSEKCINSIYLSNSNKNCRVTWCIECCSKRPVSLARRQKHNPFVDTGDWPLKLIIVMHFYCSSYQSHMAANIWSWNVPVIGISQPYIAVAVLCLHLAEIMLEKRRINWTFVKLDVCCCHVLIADQDVLG